MIKSASRIDQLLNACRPQDACLPPEHLLRIDNLEQSGWPHRPHAFDWQMYELGRQVPSGSLLVWDLDDTLLNTEHMCGNEWQMEDPLRGNRHNAAYHYRKMKPDLYLLLRRGWRLQPRLWFAATRYPFLQQFRVTAQLRPGIAAALAGMKDAGAELVLVTATARSRWNYICLRMPQFAAMFSTAYCAEELLQGQLEWIEQGFPEASCDEFGNTESITAHRKAGLSLYAKTPLLVKTMMRSEQSYDMIIDDSPILAALFEQSGLGQTLLSVDGRQPHGTYAGEIVRQVLKRLAVSTVPEEFKSVPIAGYPFIRFEDPLYFPCLHISKKLTEHARTMNCATFPAAVSLTLNR